MSYDITTMITGTTTNKADRKQQQMDTDDRYFERQDKLDAERQDELDYKRLCNQCMDEGITDMKIISDIWAAGLQDRKDRWAAGFQARKNKWHDDNRRCDEYEEWYERYEELHYQNVIGDIEDDVEDDGNTDDEGNDDDTDDEC